MKRLIKLAISVVVAGWDVLRETALKLAGRAPRATCIVLYYHAVTAEQRKRFAAQMDWLLHHARPVAAGHQQRLESGCRHAAVTFDDGFVSVIQNALPELAARNIPASIFVPTGSLGRNPAWIRNPASPNRGERVLSPEELKDLQAGRIMAIGSHSVNHANLVKAGPAQARAELVESKSRLEAILGVEVTLFSFPHGAFDERLVQQAREAGYRRVFTILPRTAFAEADEFVTGRTGVDPSDWPLEFALKLRGAYRWLCVLPALKAGLRPDPALN